MHAHIRTHEPTHTCTHTHTCLVKPVAARRHADSGGGGGEPIYSRIVVGKGPAKVMTKKVSYENASLVTNNLCQRGGWEGGRLCVQERGQERGRERERARARERARQREGEG
jgi:hypothetical protein